MNGEIVIAGVGMITTCTHGQLITEWAPQRSLRRFDLRFLGITHLGHAMRCGGRVVKKLS